MSHIMQKILVVGGNGFIGSAVCKAALAKGFEVTSVSSSGNPYRTPKGHSPAWTSKVTWLKGDALNPSTFSDILPRVDGVVHTLGTLFEGSAGHYKQLVKEGDLLGLVGTVFSGRGVQNPLKTDTGVTYAQMNRDSALRVCEAFVASGSERSYPSPRPFVFISAEDLFRPLVPAGYIESKREAEEGIRHLLADQPESYRGVYIRPSLVYHAHHRPLTTPLAALLDLSANIHSRAPLGVPTPSNILRLCGSTFGHFKEETQSMANALEIPPIHVDHVGTAVCMALDSDRQLRGVVDVKRIRELMGWTSGKETSAVSIEQSL